MAKLLSPESQTTTILLLKVASERANFVSKAFPTCYLLLPLSQPFAKVFRKQLGQIFENP